MDKGTLISVKKFKIRVVVPIFSLHAWLF